MYVNTSDKENNQTRIIILHIENQIVGEKHITDILYANSKS